MPFLYLIAGDSSSKSRLLRETLDSFEARGFKLEERREGGDWYSLFSSLRTGGLFDEKRIIIVDLADQMGEFPLKLVPYVEKTSPCGAVLIYEGKYEKIFPPVLSGVIDEVREESVPFWNDQRERWLLKFAQSKDINLEREAASLLVEWIDDPEELRSELCKLAAAVVEGCSIKPSLVRQLSLDEGRKCLLNLLDAVSSRSMPLAAASLIKLEQNKSTDILYIVGALYNRIRIAFYIQHFKADKISCLEKILKARNYQKKKAMEMLSKYDISEIDKFALLLMGLSYREKTSKAKGWRELEMIVFSFIEAGIKKG